MGTPGLPTCWEGAGGRAGGPSIWTVDWPCSGTFVSPPGMKGTVPGEDWGLASSLADSRPGHRALAQLRGSVPLCSEGQVAERRGWSLGHGSGVAWSYWPSTVGVETLWECRGQAVSRLPRVFLCDNLCLYFPNLWAGFLAATSRTWGMQCGAGPAAPAPGLLSPAGPATLACWPGGPQPSLSARSCCEAGLGSWVPP